VSFSLGVGSEHGAGLRN